MINTIHSDSTVGELVREVPARSRVFEQFGIDYCCGGKLPLKEACARRNLDPTVVLKALEEAGGITPGSVADPDAMGLAELADHIVATHHAYLREELPRLDHMTRRVASVHGDEEPRLKTIREVFLGFMAELVQHMEKEETVLFPMIRDLETADSEERGKASVERTILELEQEHDRAGNALEQFRKLSGNYIPPSWACNTFRALFDALERLEHDMHQHVHKENNVLFPKVVQRERALL